MVVNQIVSQWLIKQTNKKHSNPSILITSDDRVGEECKGCSKRLQQKSRTTGECILLTVLQNMSANSAKSDTQDRIPLQIFGAVFPKLQRQLKVATLIVESRQELQQDSRFSSMSTQLVQLPTRALACTFQNGKCLQCLTSLSPGLHQNFTGLPPQMSFSRCFCKSVPDTKL